MTTSQAIAIHIETKLSEIFGEDLKPIDVKSMVCGNTIITCAWCKEASHTSCYYFFLSTLHSCGCITTQVVRRPVTEMCAITLCSPHTAEVAMGKEPPSFDLN